MPYGRTNTYGNRTRTENAGGRPPMQTIRSSWIASVEEKKSVKGTSYLVVRTEKGLSFMVWHPPTMQAVLEREGKPEFNITIKTRDGFKRGYIDFPESE